MTDEELDATVLKTIERAERGEWSFLAWIAMSVNEVYHIAPEVDDPGPIFADKDLQRLMDMVMRSLGRLLAAEKIEAREEHGLPPVFRRINVLERIAKVSE